MINHVQVILDMQQAEEELKQKQAKETYITKLILGVGNGSGNLFVEGDYDSITRVQNMIFELEELRIENRDLKKSLKLL